MSAGSEQPSSAPAEFLFPKLNGGGSSPQLQPELLFDSRCDSQDSRRGAERGAYPSSLVFADAVWKLFRRIVGGGGRGMRWKRDGGGGTRGRAGGWCSIMGNENQGPPRGSELKWLSHAAGGCALPAENLGERKRRKRRRRHERYPSPCRRLPPFNHPPPTSPTFFCYLILSFPPVGMSFSLFNLFLLLSGASLAHFQDDLSVIWSTPIFDRSR